MSGFQELTAAEIVEIASSLRNIGVSRFSLGSLTVEFEPRFADVPEAQTEPAEQTPLERAAMMLAGRSRAA